MEIVRLCRESGEREDLMLWPSRRKALPVAVSYLAAEAMTQGREREQGYILLESLLEALKRLCAQGSLSVLWPGLALCLLLNKGFVSRSLP